MRISKLEILLPIQKKNLPTIPKTAKASDVKLIKAKRLEKPRYNKMSKKVYENLCLVGQITEAIQFSMNNLCYLQINVKCLLH